MADNLMRKLPFTRFAMEMRSGKIIEIDEGFVKMLGYTEEGVELSMHFQKKLGKGIFGGEGFIMQRLSGNGTAFVEIDGHAVEYDLSAGQEILISTGYLAAMEETCTMDVVAVKGVKNMLIGGEGIFNTVVKGPGKVILQTMPISKVAELLTPFFADKK